MFRTCVPIKRGFLLQIAVIVVLAVGAGGQAEVWNTYRNQQYGFELRYPDQFVVGTYKVEIDEDTQKTYRAAGLRLPFEDAIALVEKSRIGNRGLTDLPPGFTSITIRPYTGDDAKHLTSFASRVFMKRVSEMTLGRWKTLKLPGYPGPYGQNLFYYQVPVSEELLIEFIAHKTYEEAPKGATQYDRVIEAIIPTLKVFQRKP